MYGEMKGNRVIDCIYSLFKAFYRSWNVRPQHLKTRTQVSEMPPAMGPRGPGADIQDPKGDIGHSYPNP